MTLLTMKCHTTQTLLQYSDFGGYEPLFNMIMNSTHIANQAHRRLYGLR